MKSVFRNYYLKGGHLDFVLGLSLKSLNKDNWFEKKFERSFFNHLMNK